MRDTSNKHIAFRVHQQVKDRLERFAEYDGLSISDICRRSVLQTLREHEQKLNGNKPSAWSV